MDSVSLDPSDMFILLPISDTDGDSVNYYEDYCKLLVSNNLLKSKIRELKEESDELKTQLENFVNAEERTQRKRRKAQEIQRFFQCRSCSKAYGSEASLKNHWKIKHSEEPYNFPSRNKYE